MPLAATGLKAAINPAVMENVISIIRQNPDLVRPILGFLPPGVSPLPGFLGDFPTGPAPAPQPSPAGLPVDLRIALARVPIANEGNVITSEYHNSVRNVLLAMAQLFGAGAVAPAINVSFAPQFVTPGGANWVPTELGVSNGASVTSAFGWMSVALPDEARIASMTVFGKKTVTVKNLKFTLVRYLLSDTNQAQEPLISLDATAETGDFSPADSIKTDPSLGTNRALATLDDQQLIQNGKFKYVFRAQLNCDASAQDSVQIHAIQIACSLGGIGS
jgi:hypothetical protein